MLLENEQRGVVSLLPSWFNTGLTSWFDNTTLCIGLGQGNKNYSECPSIFMVNPNKDVSR